jgi:hypothetical protein
LDPPPKRDLKKEKLEAKLSEYLKHSTKVGDRELFRELLYHFELEGIDCYLFLPPNKRSPYLEYVRLQLKDVAAKMTPRRGGALDFFDDQPPCDNRILFDQLKMTPANYRSRA